VRRKIITAILGLANKPTKAGKEEVTIVKDKIERDLAGTNKQLGMRRGPASR